MFTDVFLPSIERTCGGIDQCGRQAIMLRDARCIKPAERTADENHILVVSRRHDRVQLFDGCIRAPIQRRYNYSINAAGLLAVSAGELRFM